MSRVHDGNAHEFRVLLPLAGPATHVVELHGSTTAFSAALHDRVRVDLVAASALYGPTSAVSLGELADILNSLGEASVLSIDPL
jgi:hypothetical protein